MILHSGTGIINQYITQTTTCFGNANVLTTVGGYEKTTEGYNTPNFHARKRAGEIIPTTIFRQTEWSLERTGSYQYGNDDNTCVASFPGPIPVGVRGGFAYKPSDAEIASVVEGIDRSYLLQAAVAGISADFDALTFLAEFRQLPKMLWDASVRLDALFNDTRRWNVVGTWMELRYGWRPFIKDLEDIYNVVKHWNDLHGEFVRRQRSAAIAQTLESSVNSSWSIIEAAASEYSSVNSTVTVSGRATAIARMKPPKMMVNPAVTAWELIPLSFVIDWIVDVGMAIRAVSNSLIHSDMDTSTGLQVTVDSTSTGHWTASRGWASLTLEGKYYSESVERLPVSVDSLPKAKIRFDQWKFIDLVFIAIQQIVKYRVKGRKMRLTS
jgi:hypothetical protein